MNKELIKTRFSKHLDTYIDNANIQFKMAKKLITYLNKKEYKNILEIGCGTGLLTKLLNNEITFENFIANDIVPECSDFIQKINPKIKFLSGDIEELISQDKQKYDLIISNASFQWIENFEEFIKRIVSKLNKDGILIFSSFGCENLREITFIVGNGLKYYSMHELGEILAVYNPFVEEEIHVMSFNSPMDVLKHLQLTGVNAIESKIWTKKDIKDFENNYNNLCFNRITLTYNPIYVVIKH